MLWQRQVLLLLPVSSLYWLLGPHSAEVQWGQFKKILALESWICSVFLCWCRTQSLSVFEPVWQGHAVQDLHFHLGFCTKSTCLQSEQWLQENLFLGQAHFLSKGHNDHVKIRVAATQFCKSNEKHDQHVLLYQEWQFAESVLVDAESDAQLKQNWIVECGISVPKIAHLFDDQ